MNKPSRLLMIAACSVGAALGGCGGLLTSDQPAMTTWWLEPLAPASASTAFPGGLDLELEVSVVPGLDTDRILTLGPDAQLSHLVGARWADNLPDVLESVLRRSFQAAGTHESVAAEGGDNDGDCRVQIEFQEFFARLDRAGEVASTYITYTAKMECGGVAEAVSMANGTPARANSKAGIVASFQQGLNEITRSLRSQLVNLASEQATPKPSGPG